MNEEEEIGRIGEYGDVRRVQRYSKRAKFLYGVVAVILAVIIMMEHGG